MFFGLWNDSGISEDDPRFLPMRDFIKSPGTMPAGQFLQRLEEMLADEENPLAAYDPRIVRRTRAAPAG